VSRDITFLVSSLVQDQRNLLSVSLEDAATTSRSFSLFDVDRRVSFFLEHTTTSTTMSREIYFDSFFVPCWLHHSEKKKEEGPQLLTRLEEHHVVADSPIDSLYSLIDSSLNSISIA
jgi:hypothetical protein